MEDRSPKNQPFDVEEKGSSQNRDSPIETPAGNSSPTSQTPPPPAAPSNSPPNGGLTAWLQVVGAHFLFFNSWGIVNTFGVYQDFYQSHYLTANSPSDISWIGTVQGFLMIVVGGITGPLYDMGYLHTLIYLGSFLNVFGLMMTSLSTKYYEVFLSLGVCVGLGSACLFVPSVAIAATYFSTKRAAATGLVATGGSLGGVIYPIVFRHLQVQIGYGWATRVIGFIALGTLAISAVTLKPRVLPAKKRSLIDPRAFRDIPYIFYSIALFLVFSGLYIPFFYISVYAAERLNTSESLAFYLLAILNAASIFGRIIPNIVADYVGPINVLVPFTFIASVLIFAWLGIPNLAGVIVFCILYGFFSGAIVSLAPSALVVLCPDLSVIGTRMGMSLSLAGFGLLIGNPIAGVVLKSAAGFTGLKAFSGVMVMGGFMSFAVALFIHRQSLIVK